MEKQLNIAFGSTEGKCNHRHHYYLVSWGEGGFEGAAWDHLMTYSVQFFGWW